MIPQHQTPADRSEHHTRTALPDREILVRAVLRRRARRRRAAQRVLARRAG